MARISIIEPLVEKALRENELTRKDNFVLYVEVLRNYIHTESMTFEDVCLHHVELGVPSLETITRCRRKLQEKHPELVDPDTAKARAIEEEEHYEYSRS